MQHSYFKQERYQSNRQWAKTQPAVNPILHLANGKKRKDFASLCLPLYQKYYPEILEDIHGIADEWQVPYEDISAFLFSMYCFDLQNKCTCFAFKKNQQIIFGRNSDFLTALESSNDSCYYQLENAHAFIGHTTAFVQMEDGINDCGLAVGLTFVVPHFIKPGLNAGMLVRYLLEKCQNVKEAVDALRCLPIASSQTITILDRTGEMAVIECTAKELQIIRPKPDESFVTATNQFQVLKTPLTDIDNWDSDIRYQTARQALQKGIQSDALLFADDLLSGKYGFMCQYDRSTGHDTVWSVIYDLSQKRIFRSEGNPSRVPFQEDKRLIFQS